jgi:hypothetical protein
VIPLLIAMMLAKGAKPKPRELDKLDRYEPAYAWDPKRKGYYPAPNDPHTLLKKRKLHIP